MNLHKNTGTGSDTPPPRQEGMTRQEFDAREEKVCTYPKGTPEFHAALSDIAVNDALQRETITRLEGENLKMFEACLLVRDAASLFMRDRTQSAMDELERINSKLNKLPENMCPNAYSLVRERDDLQARLTASEAKVNELEADMITLQRLLTSSRSTHKWTKEQPTVAGFYWWREDRGMKGWLVDVLADLTVKAITGDGDQIDFLHVIEIGGEWQGPLTPGEE